VKPLVIGIDSSTTACKAIAWDCEGQIAAEGGREHTARAMTGTTSGFGPRADSAQPYDLLYADVYRHLYPKLQPLLHRLADIRDGARMTALVPN